MALSPCGDSQPTEDVKWQFCCCLRHLRGNKPLLTNAFFWMCPIYRCLNAEVKMPPGSGSLLPPGLAALTLCSHPPLGEWFGLVLAPDQGQQGSIPSPPPPASQCCAAQIPPVSFSLPFCSKGVSQRFVFESSRQAVHQEREILGLSKLLLSVQWPELKSWWELGSSNLQLWFWKNFHIAKEAQI